MGIILLTIKAFAVAMIDDNLLCLGLNQAWFCNHDDRRGAR